MSEYSEAVFKALLEGRVTLIPSARGGSYRVSVTGGADDVARIDSTGPYEGPEQLTITER